MRHKPWNSWLAWSWAKQWSPTKKSEIGKSTLEYWHRQRSKVLDIIGHLEALAKRGGRKILIAMK